ncbi:MAG: nucleoside-diphosphate kinase [Pseudomonadota bacterium]
MTIQRTLSIIKPDAVRKNNIGAITQRFEEAGLRVVAAKMQKLTTEQAKEFYGVHSDKSFFYKLVEFICSGPVMIQVLEGPDAIQLNRQLMGATDPKQAAPGTIRAEFAESIDQNAVHGSDSLETAQQEIGFFFTQDQCFSREP